MYLLDELFLLPGPPFVQIWPCGGHNGCPNHRSCQERQKSCGLPRMGLWHVHAVEC